MSETLICVADDVGLRVWLERVLQVEWELECVTSSDLSRVSRLLQTTGARLAVVAVDENDAGRSLKVFAAIQKACPNVRLVGVSQRISQDLLLNIMRAGARDCLITSQDSESALDRVRRVWQSAADNNESRFSRSRRGNVTAVVGASQIVDTRFFTENFAVEVNYRSDGTDVLAIDSDSTESRTFYYDSLNRLTLRDLINHGDGFDRSFIETALEEYAPGLRLLSGQVASSELEGDAGADLFITITELASFFDHLIIRIDQALTDAWLKAIGSDVDRVIVVSHQTVDQVRNSQALLKTVRSYVPSECQLYFVLDGYEKRANLSSSDVEKNAGCECNLSLPLEWKHRLDSINAGISMSSLPYRTAYQKRLGQFVQEHFRKESDAKWRLFGKRVNEG